MVDQCEDGKVSVHVPLLIADGADPIGVLESRLAVARKLLEAGWTARAANRGLVFEAPSQEAQARLETLDLGQGLDGVPTFAGYFIDPPDKVAGPHNNESPWLRFGHLSLPSGKLMIGDPLAFRQYHREVDLPAGEYTLMIRANSTSGYGTTTRVRIARTLAGTLGEALAEVEVDTGHLGFYDRVLGDALNPAVPAGYGDGIFKVREILDGAGRIGIEVDFMEWYRVGDDPIECVLGLTRAGNTTRKAKGSQT
jgi:hypothetical protein